MIWITFFATSHLLRNFLRWSRLHFIEQCFALLFRKHKMWTLRKIPWNHTWNHKLNLWRPFPEFLLNFYIWFIRLYHHHASQELWTTVMKNYNRVCFAECVVHDLNSILFIWCIMRHGSCLMILMCCYADQKWLFASLALCFNRKDLWI